MPGTHLVSTIVRMLGVTAMTSFDYRDQRRPYWDRARPSPLFLLILEALAIGLMLFVLMGPTP